MIPQDRVRGLLISMASHLKENNLPHSIGDARTALRVVLNVPTIIEEVTPENAAKMKNLVTLLMKGFEVELTKDWQFPNDRMSLFCRQLPKGCHVVNDSPINFFELMLRFSPYPDHPAFLLLKKCTKILMENQK